MMQPTTSFIVLGLTMGSMSFAASAPSVHVLVYETELNNDREFLSPAEHLVDQINDRVNGMTASVFGQGNSFSGFGSKFSAVLPILREIQVEDPESIVVISDSRDVLINNPFHEDTYATLLADEFRSAYEELTDGRPGSIVISAEAQCCVSALTHVSPGMYYHADGSRKQRACSSGAVDCLWAGDDKARPWESFMENLMTTRTPLMAKDMYLNAGLIAGKAKDLIRVVVSAQIGEDEDDQAVLTDYMFHNPNDIVLDYQQIMFGNNRAGVSNYKSEGCIFTSKTSETRLFHSETNTAPLFVHSPGGFYECHDKLADLLGVPAVTNVARRRLSQNRKLQNYGRFENRAPLFSNLKERITNRKKLSDRLEGLA
jgi:hypothetical protein